VAWNKTAAFGCALAGAVAVQVKVQAGSQEGELHVSVSWNAPVY
jgi:acyl-CoA synthetase (AMP-forming)/AMP-acid ligase II